MTLLLGILIGLVTGIAANLLTPLAPRLWITLVSMQRHGYQAQIQQKIKTLQFNLDQLNRFGASDRDLYLYLFQWLLGIISIIVTAIACAVIAVTTSEERLFTVSLALLILAAVSSLVILLFCHDVTATGIQKKTAKLEADISKLRAKLPGP
jgi:hypothetical protein